MKVRRELTLDFLGVSFINTKLSHYLLVIVL